MMLLHESNLYRTLAAVLDQARLSEVFNSLQITPSLLGMSEHISRSEFSMALNAVLFSDLLQRVPTGAQYVEEKVAEGGKIIFDHGALRTIRFDSQSTGFLPGGVDSISRILEPLGYAHSKCYPLPALNMTGHAWCHLDQPETIPQFFVSELHVESFSEEFQGAADRIFGESWDPISAGAREILDIFEQQNAIPLSIAAYALKQISSAFGRQHEIFDDRDYDILLSESAEAAWIATEGNAFNHATDRVEDVETLAEKLRSEGKPIKKSVEHSASGRVRQTAFHADLVERQFTNSGKAITRSVPGSFYEFISRDIDPATGRLDLSFDSSNAQGIFAMTKAA